MTRAVSNSVLVVMFVVLAAVSADAAIISYVNDSAGYFAATGGHTLFVDFETDKNGSAVSGTTGSISGDTFSDLVAYSSPSQSSTDVNIARHSNPSGNPVLNEIGPLGTWDGILRWDYVGSDYWATSFTGVEVEASTTIHLYDDGSLVDWTSVGGTYVGGTGSNQFQFFGFVSDAAFDAVELNGDFYAIDAHGSTSAGVVPEPTTLAALLGMGGMGLLAARRRRKAA